MDDTMWLDATAQAELVANGEVSAEELTAAAIAGVERLDPRLNAVIHRRFDKAAEEAAGPLPDGPFRGVPMVVKDLGLTTAGDPYHMGVRALKDADHRADADSYLAQRFRRAGFVIVGRTNTPELGSTVTTEPLAHGPTRNPWDPTRSTGGSSGGSAAAVAAGMVAVGHAGDGGGSIRVPASECGLVGLKPTRARVTAGPGTGEAWAGCTIDHVVTRSVRDTARVLDAVAGPAPGDPYTAPRPVRPFAQEVGADPGRLRVGFHVDMATLPGEVHPECVLAVRRTLATLEALGHVVDDARPEAFSDPELRRRFVAVVAAFTAKDLDDIAAMLGRPLVEGDVEQSNWQLAEMGRSVTALDYLHILDFLHAYQRRMARWWAAPGDEGGGEGFDLLVTPVVAAPPPELGWLSDPVEGLRRLAGFMQFTSQFNVSGQPAISLPLHWTSDGLPVGVQLVAAYGREDVLIRVASQLEQAMPWSHRRPAISA